MIDLENELREGKVILVDKPYTWTSYNVVGKVKSWIKSVNTDKTKKIKVGHAGTLDPLATGLLIVCTGKFTKRIEEFQAQAKEYTGTFVLGASTPSYDLETEIITHGGVGHISLDMLNEAVRELSGEIEQTPPIFSAVKVNGKRAYEFARKDEQVELKAKKIHIYEFELTRIELPDVDFKIRCSKGTYIRSIARDFGEKLQSAAYLSALRRTKIGEYKVEDALDVRNL